MKIALTGHTSGIGKALFEKLTFEGHNVVGFSRANGYDISKPSLAGKLIQESLDCDVFINNAYAGMAQVYMLYQLFEHWKAISTKTIVNIGSNTGDWGQMHVHPYGIHKRALDETVLQLNRIPDKKCRIFNFRPGWVNTPFSEKHLGNAASLMPHEVADTIIWALQMPSHISINSLTIEAVKQSNNSMTTFCGWI